jgi:hypothetical protein
VPNQSIFVCEFEQLLDIHFAWLLNVDGSSFNVSFVIVVRINFLNLAHLFKVKVLFLENVSIFK